MACNHPEAIRCQVLIGSLDQLTDCKIFRFSLSIFFFKRGFSLRPPSLAHDDHLLRNCASGPVGCSPSNSPHVHPCWAWETLFWHSLPTPLLRLLPLPRACVHHLPLTSLSSTPQSLAKEAIRAMQEQEQPPLFGVGIPVIPWLKKSTRK